ncbi:MAG: ABC transporter ATP-binding protein [Candidatus Sumerlaeaceae bacterium]|nr:ABC transporter ATP-binding protein [Candidatus Sumerlaeaceae bacterium]
MTVPTTPAPLMPAVELRAVTRRFDKQHVTALQDVSLVFHAGESVAIIGPSGSGKTTLLNLISGLDRPTSGEILFGGQAPKSQRDWTSIRARNIGLVFQSFHLLSTLTAAQNVEVPMMGVAASSGERSRRSTQLLTAVGLGARCNHYPGELSGGERQRVAIARSLANGPQLILADEPTGNLDSANAEKVLRLLLEMHRDHGAALVIVTHDERIAQRCTRIIRILDGRVIANRLTALGAGQ